MFSVHVIIIIVLVRIIGRISNLFFFTKERVRDDSVSVGYENCDLYTHRRWYGVVWFVKRSSKRSPVVDPQEFKLRLWWTSVVVQDGHFPSQSVLTEGKVYGKRLCPPLGTKDDWLIWLIFSLKVLGEAPKLIKRSYRVISSPFMKGIWIVK